MNEDQSQAAELRLPVDFDTYSWEIEAKGYFGQAVLNYEGRSYQLSFYDPVRIAQEIDDEISSSTVFFEPNLIVVEAVTRPLMHRAVMELLSRDKIEDLFRSR